VCHHKKGRDRWTCKVTQASSEDVLVMMFEDKDIEDV